MFERLGWPGAGPVVALASVLALVPQAARAQDYPNKVVQIVNPTLAGATTDVLARVLANGLASRLGQQFVVVNRPGAGGAIGTLSVARAEPDGYTLWFGAVYALSVLSIIKTTEAGYSADALTPVCQTVSNAMVIAVRPDSPFKTLADLIAAARKEPGKISYGHQGAGSIPNLAMEEFIDTAGLKIRAIPYRGDPAVITDLLGGNIDVAALVQGTVAGQNLRVLGIFSEERHPAFPGVPTFREQGYDVAPISFGGVMAPATTPEPILEKLAAACEGAAREPAYVEAAKRGGQPDNYYASRQVFAERFKRDIEAKKRLLTKMGLVR
ncbi:MAG: tripartite tricarboxylate transporter substrate binding protein [Variibacter sp.]|nr:tripartite tricarboxylate transporter substrate binding protein [Variibacter sp.]